MKIGSAGFVCATLVATTVFAATGAETVAPMEPDWCEGFKPWGANAAKNDVTSDALAKSFEKEATSSKTLWIASQLSCETPKDAKVQKAVAAVRQAFVNETGQPDSDARLQLKLRADAAQWTKDMQVACPARHVEAAEDQLLYYATGMVLCNGTGGKPYVAASWQAFSGGLNSVWPGFLGYFWNYLERGNSDELAEIGVLLQKFDPKSYLEKEKNRALAARGLQLFYTARKAAKARNLKVANSRGTLEWFDRREKAPALFEAIAAVHRAEAGVTAKTPEWLPACEALHQAVLKVHPSTEPTNSKAITTAFNVPEMFDALKVLEYCGMRANDRPRAGVYSLLRSDIVSGTRVKEAFPGPSMEWQNIAAPFALNWQAPERFNFLSKDDFPWIKGDNFTGCTWAGGTGIGSDGSYAGATVQSLKETPEGTVVTFKTESWQTDNMVCDNDNTYHYDHVGNLQRGVKCVKKGTKTVKFSEPPMLLNKNHGVPGIKPGIYLSVATHKCPTDAKGKPIKASPLITYPSFKQAERKDILTYFWWTMKSGGSAGAAPAAAKTAKAGKKK